MNLFKKKENIKEAIPLIALLSALDVILITLANLIPFASYFIMFLISIPSLLAGIYLLNKHYLLYVIVSIFITFITSFYDLTFLFIYFVPSLVTSFIFSLFIKKKYDLFILILVNTIIELIIEMLFIFIFNILLNINIINDLYKLFNISSDNLYIDIFIPLFFLTYSLINILLNLFISYFVLSKLKIHYVISIHSSLYLSLISIIVLLLSIVFNILSGVYYDINNITSLFKIFTSISYILLYLLIVTTIFLLINEIKKKRFYFLVILFTSLILTIILINLISISILPLIIAIYLLFIPFTLTNIAYLIRFTYKIIKLKNN